MSQHLIAEFAFQIKIIKFCDLFLYSNLWYKNFLINNLNDLNVIVGDWNECSDKSKVREIKSDHPSKVSFPGLPSHAGLISLLFYYFSFLTFLFYYIVTFHFFFLHLN